MAGSAPILQYSASCRGHGRVRPMSTHASDCVLTLPDVQVLEDDGCDPLHLDGRGAGQQLSARSQAREREGIKIVHVILSQVAGATRPSQACMISAPDLRMSLLACWEPLSGSDSWSRCLVRWQQQGEARWRWDEAQEVTTR